jgi:Tol biopolymer transport system component
LGFTFDFPEKPYFSHLPVAQDGVGRYAEHLKWSPSGQLIAFIAAVDRGKALWLVDRDGSNPREVLNDVSYFDWYDNQHILFVSQDKDGRAQVQTVELTSRAVTLLFQSPAIELDVSRDASKLLYTSAGSHFGMNLWVQPLRAGPNGTPIRNGDPVQITAGGGDWHVHKGAWSPDGKTIVYTRDSDQGDIYTTESYR